jgi:DNA-binding LacI/PurR family transcriptional regulator
MQGEGRRLVKKKRATLADVGRLAGVSASVAGAVLNGGGGNSRVSLDTEERIRRIAAQLNYRPHLAARQMQGKRTQTYGLILDSVGNMLRTKLVEHLYLHATQNGCQILPAYTSVGEASGQQQLLQSIDNFVYRGVDGVLCAIHPGYFVPDYSALLESFSSLVFYSNPGIPGTAYVEPDCEEALRLVVRHFAGAGRKRIAFMYLSDDPEHKRHLRGYRDEVQAQGFQYEEALTFNADYHGPNYPHTDDEIKEVVDLAILRLVREQGADAVACLSDFWATMLLKSMRKHMLEVPGDVAVTGYHNSYWANLADPTLTSVDEQDDIAAMKMVDLLERMISNEDVPWEERVIKVPPRIVVRESSIMLKSSGIEN